MVHETLLSWYTQSGTWRSNKKSKHYPNILGLKVGFLWKSRVFRGSYTISRSNEKTPLETAKSADFQGGFVRSSSVTPLGLKPKTFRTGSLSHTSPKPLCTGRFRRFLWFLSKHLPNILVHLLLNFLVLSNTTFGKLQMLKPKFLGFGICWCLNYFCNA